MGRLYLIISSVALLSCSTGSEAASPQNSTENDKYRQVDNACVTEVTAECQARTAIECLITCNNTLLPQCAAVTFLQGTCQMSTNTTTRQCSSSGIKTYQKYSCSSPYVMVELGGGMTKCVQITTAADTLDWSSAKESCESQGGHLITFKSKTESVLFGDYLFAQVSAADKWYIGGEKVNDTTWYWRGILSAEIEAAEFNWHSGHSGAESECLYYQTGGTDGASNGWNSHTATPCTTAMRYICEK